MPLHTQNGAHALLAMLLLQGSVAKALSESLTNEVSVALGNIIVIIHGYYGL